MGLDITFTEREDVICPHCGEKVNTKDIETVHSCGRNWYPIMESIGYYVPWEKRTEENDWYGKDMVLTNDQAMEVYKRVLTSEDTFYYGEGVLGLIARATLNKNQVVVNADW